MTETVRDNAARHRFELDADGHTAIANYRLSPGVITFTHTEVPEALRGQGIGSRIARGVLDTARARGLRVVAQCEFLSDFIHHHPEYADLL